MKAPNVLMPIILLLGMSNLPAATYYVAAGSTNPIPPYATWDTAATNIQDAVAVATTSDVILVTNGVYVGNLFVTNELNVISVNGPEFTLIVGGQSIAGGQPCATLSQGASLSGFTLTNGAPGVREINSTTNAFLTNCVFIGNTDGGASGVVLYNCTLVENVTLSYGGGAAGCQLYNCTLNRNVAYGSGGGAYGSTLYNCTLSNNEAGVFGAGAIYCTLSNCSLIGNSAYEYGGGAQSSTLYNCIIGSNTTHWLGHGEGGGVFSCRLYNCLLSGNTSDYKGGGAFGSSLFNCTVWGNSVDFYGDSGGVSGSGLNNCIVYSNTAPRFANYDPSLIPSYCCTTPLPTNGIGNITNAPLFVDFANGNFRLQPNSPCVNAGNNAYMTTATDLDGNPRVVGATVDIGAYECQFPALLAFYDWLQSYGLPTDASSYYLDSDGDGMNNWQEWVCGTNPTNAASVLKMLTPTVSGSGSVVPWLSVTNRDYFLQRASNLRAQPAFLTLATNIPGQPGSTTFTDTNAAGGPFFYRVGVHQ